LTHGDVVPVDEPFSVNGSELMYPGDPAGPASETINCRCTVATVIPELEDTSLVSDEKIAAELEKRGEVPTVAEPTAAPARDLERERFREFEVTKPGDEAEVDNWAMNSSYDAWNATLTPQQRAILESYKASDYEYLNPVWRGEPGAIADLDLIGMNKKQFDQATRNLDSALRQHRLPNDVRLWRGGSHPEITAALESGKSLEDLQGMVISDDAPVSTSLNSDASDNFVRWAGKDGVKFEIQAPRGTYGAYIEYMKETASDMQEFEFLLARGTKMEILDASVRDGVKHIVTRVLF
jgi:hypothetical protein